MLYRASRLSSAWKFFHEEYERLTEAFVRLCYSDNLVHSTIRQFIESKVSEKQEAPIRIVLPFNPLTAERALRALIDFTLSNARRFYSSMGTPLDGKGLNIRNQLMRALSRKVNVNICPVSTSRKIKDEIKVSKGKPPLENQQCVVYHFNCDLCGAGYVGYTCRHLHERNEEHKGSAVGNRRREQHDLEPDHIAQSLRILRKCQNKCDCLVFEMFFFLSKTQNQR